MSERITESILWKKGYRLDAKGAWYKPVGGLVSTQPQPNPVSTLDKKPPAQPCSKRRVVVIVTLVRYGHQLLDDDNLVSSFKPLRDSIAKSIGVDDGDKRFRWEYGQVQTRGETGCNVKITVVKSKSR